MAKFIYKMQNILSMKYKMEDQAKTAYGNARLKLTEEEMKLENLHYRVSQYMDMIRDSMQSALKIQELIRCEEAIKAVKYQIKDQEIAIKKAQKNLEIARSKLNMAMMERKTHENLKDHALENFMKEFESEQRKEIDELVSFKYNSPTQ